LKEITKEETDLFYNQEEYLLLHFICSLLGFFILIFSLIVFIYAPGKTIAKFGTVFDITDKNIGPTGKNSNLLILLDDGKLVKVPKPTWFNLSPQKTVILQETSSMFLGVKRYSFYNKPQKPYWDHL